MGKHKRDFTYIDDIVDGVIKATFHKNKNKFDIYNLNNGKIVNLMDYIKVIEKNLGLSLKSILKIAKRRC